MDISKISSNGYSHAAAEASTLESKGSEGSFLTNPKTDFKIAIRAIDIGGLGDYASAAKIQDYVQRVFKGRIAPQNIQIFMESKERNTALFPKTTFNPLPEAKEFNPDMVISFPGNREMNTNFQKEHLARPVPTLFWSELGVYVDTDQDPIEVDGKKVTERLEVISSGLNEKEYGSRTEDGIFLNRELVNWGSASRSSKERLSQLEFSSPGLQKAILGESHSSKAISKFSDKQRLFHGYTNETGFGRSKGAPSAMIYLQALATMNREMVDVSKETLKSKMIRIVQKRDTKRKDMTVVLMGKHNLTASHKGGLNNLDTTNHFRKCGFSDIKVYEYDKSTGELKLTEAINLLREPEGPWEKAPDRKHLQTMRVITGNIPHSDALVLTKASEDETIVTGDSSLSEAISARKSFIYQKLPHKRELASGLSQRYDGIFINSSEQARSLRGVTEDLRTDKPGAFFVQNRKIHAHKAAGGKVIREWDLEKNVKPKLESFVERLQNEKEELGATVAFDPVPEAQKMSGRPSDLYMPFQDDESSEEPHDYGDFHSS